jgi:4-amino-4-deoxy-L-arabinose transferase-like glycosyltransferase
MRNPSFGGSLRAERLALAGAIAIVLLYTAYQALTLRVDYYDSYDYLRNARALLGDPSAKYSEMRPPFIPIVQLPATAIAIFSASASTMRLIAPHLTAAGLSVLTALSIFWVFRRPLGVTLALLGTLLFVGTRYFVHYGAFAMADVASAGWTAATFALYARARSRPSPAAYVLSGVAFGCAALTKYPLVVTGFALAMAEVVFSLREQKHDLRRWVGLVGIGVVGAMVFVGTQAIVLFALDSADWPKLLVRLLLQFATVSNWAGDPTESWHDHVSMAAAMMSIPTLLMSVVGFLVAIFRMQDRDIPFLAWLAVIGGTIVLVIGHNEARYLLPAVPAILYFAIRGLEAAAAMLRTYWPWRPRVLYAAGGLVFLGSALWVGVDQAIRDRDPVFRADTERLAAQQMSIVAGSQGRLLWFGHYHTLHAGWAGFVPHDDYFGTFHFAPMQIEYFTGRRFAAEPRPWPADPRLLSSMLRDGDAILRAADTFYSALDLPAGGVPPMEVWSVRRLELLRSDNGRFADHRRPELGIHLREASGHLYARSEAIVGKWTLLAKPTGDAELVALGDVVFETDRETLVGARPAAQIESLQLFHFDRTVFR